MNLAMLRTSSNFSMLGVALKSNGVLRKLSLAATQLTDAGAAQLAAGAAFNETLAVLWLHGNTRLTDAARCAVQEAMQRPAAVLLPRDTPLDAIVSDSDSADDDGGNDGGRHHHHHQPRKAVVNEANPGARAVPSVHVALKQRN